ncbi:subtype B tannase [Streptomyces sp. NPDC044989]|uniref:subtype B tannase n=1 Tax=Streptomyces sp. NPDC044989 TaxID=3154336 RepID=UPI0033CC89C0
MKHRAVTRRSVVIGLGATAGVAAIGGIALTAQAEDTEGTDSKGASANDSLAFDQDDYKEKTESIADASGTEHSVTYRFYKARDYVTNPSDSDHQSLVVSVPVDIDGKAVDASHAPIVLANAVGAYMPSTVADATGVGQAKLEMSGMGGGAMLGGTPTGGSTPSGMPSGGTDGGTAGGTGAINGMVNLAKLALAAGYVVVEPGTRGRSLTDSSGNYYGTAPAVIVDLKAAVRYIRANKGRLPGNTERIVSTGTSAGGASSALLGASGDSKIYEPYLREAGAADGSDAIFATGAWCPITDLEHADGAYEWNWGTLPTQTTGKTVDQSVSRELQSQFAEYQAGLNLRGLKGSGFGKITARNYDEYLLEHYLQPSATTYLAALSASERETYLAKNTFITWKNSQATFTWEGYLTHVAQRKKTQPAFDAFDLSAGENNEFGKDTTKARHFTAYSAKNDTTGLGGKRVDSDIPEKLKLMNPMFHILEEGNPNRSKHWWIRLGTSDTDTALTVAANLAMAADNLGDDVNHAYYWDMGHATNEDPGDFIKWVAKVTGYKS